MSKVENVLAYIDPGAIDAASKGVVEIKANKLVDKFKRQSTQI